MTFQLCIALDGINHPQRDATFENTIRMNTQNETKTIRDFINAFGEALSMSDHKQISTFYAADGLFFPNNFPTISRDQLNKAKGAFLKNRKFKVNFNVSEVVLKENLAFVQAIAKATTTQLGDDVSITVVSRDLFVLSKADNEWKIFRYMFNDLSAE